MRSVDGEAEKPLLSEAMRQGTHHRSSITSCIDNYLRGSISAMAASAPINLSRAAAGHILRLGRPPRMGEGV